MLSFYKQTSKNQANGTVLATAVGPITGRNWFNINLLPLWNFSQTGAGTVKLQGTNDIVYSAGNSGVGLALASDFGPSPTASWADIFAATAANTTNTFSTSYQFLRLIVAAQGTGIVWGYVTWKY